MAKIITEIYICCFFCFSIKFCYKGKWYYMSIVRFQKMVCFWFFCHNFVNPLSKLVIKQTKPMLAYTFTKKVKDKTDQKKRNIKTQSKKKIKKINPLPIKVLIKNQDNTNFWSCDKKKKLKEGSIHYWGDRN